MLKVNSSGITHDSCFNVEYSKLYCENGKYVKFSFVWSKNTGCNDSEMNESICFAPEPLLG